MSKNFNLIFRGCLKVVYIAKSPFKRIYKFLIHYSNMIYSSWIGFRFNCKRVHFGYPINWTKGEYYIKIGEKTRFGRHVVLTAWNTFCNDKFNPEISIGNNCIFGDYLHITCINKIKIGNNVLTGRWVTISDNNHGNNTYEDLLIAPSKRKLYSKGGILIGDNVWIGDKATILSGVRIGEGAVIGANSVITKDIPAFTIVGGSPAKIIRSYS